ncbi:GspE/PulE family protein [Paenactinomyces guangxiensis]|uniref:Type II/IV secretion system protein n=1 Tax=Paenactinomyces guangxiensis TaxID=1490290 RepID=A0A7W1WNS3_9BACL|nr:GspE/PulE family protein [Paenactinomyces guangxiensis]MBA4493267.1 type II/IV secretion system protein [Paenactinomyces guangxiensis]MBH8589882.1 type II/IV secretion system protein [Paenactinomyces guangxiensis]
MDIVTYISNLFERATELRASDIHIEPQADGLRIRLRVDGFLVEIDRLPKQKIPAVISRLKVMSHLDIGEKRVPQDGAMAIASKEGKLDVRISTLPTLFGEKIVLRLLRNRPETASLDQLGMEREEIKRLQRLLAHASGLLIVTGPTGAGKTTTLYAMLQYLNHKEANLVTLEDPVELQIPGINQVQIHPRAGLTFAQGLRAVLRQDPNVIMVGEIRDRETADIAIRAALTGHLVLTTLHTSDGASAVTRLLDMNIEPYRVAAALSGVVAQRLVRLVCNHCGGEGCAECQEMGYRGRTGAFEVIIMEEGVQQLVVNRSPLTELRQYFQSRGMSSLREAVMAKVKKGETTYQEYIRVAEDVEQCLEFREVCPV